MATLLCIPPIMDMQHQSYMYFLDAKAVLLAWISPT